VNRTRFVLAATLVLGTCTAPAEPSATQRFLWSYGNALMALAGDTNGFDRAAAVYDRLLRTGVRNGPLFYNRGLALLGAGRREDAVRAFLRAERYMGSDADIRRNLRIALAPDPGRGTASLPWYRFPLAWHFALSAPVRLALTVIPWCAFWGMLILRKLGWRRHASAVLAATILIAALFASSVLTSVFREHQDELRALRARRPGPPPGSVSSSVTAVERPATLQRREAGGLN
jgi:hypothetical protein